MNDFKLKMLRVYENNEKLSHLFSKRFFNKKEKSFCYDAVEDHYTRWFNEGLLEIDESYVSPNFLKLKMSDAGKALFEFERL